MRWKEARRCVRGAWRHSGERKTSLGELLGGCAACCVGARRGARGWEVENFEGNGAFGERMVRWVQGGLMARFGLEVGRLIEEDAIRNEERMR